MNPGVPPILVICMEFMQFNNGVFFGPVFEGAYDAAFSEALGHHLNVQAGDLEIIKQPLDWWGFNYYFPETVIDNSSKNAVFPATKTINSTKVNTRTDIGWEIKSEGMSHLLHTVYNRYDNIPPCYITENGACYNTEVGNDGTVSDQSRLDFLNDHLHVLADAIDQGIPMKGYFAWSLMDNFEWAEGYKMRFGIVHVNYTTQKRTIKKSGHWYKELSGKHRNL